MRESSMFCFNEWMSVFECVLGQKSSPIKSNFCIKMILVGTEGVHYSKCDFSSKVDFV
jgi:hypothetical protein